MTVLESAQWVSAAAWVALALAAVRLWGRDRGAPAAWVARAFVTLGFVAVSGPLLPDPPVVVERLVLVALLAFPWLLSRFVASLQVGNRTVGRAIDVLALTVLAVAVGAPSFPEPGGPQPRWLAVYTLVAVAYWLMAHTQVAFGLLAASAEQPRIVRHRLRRLAGGAVLLGVSLIAVSMSGADPEGRAALVATGLGLAASLLFLNGFAPGPALRRRWRQDGERRIDEAAEALMGTTTRPEVTRVLLPCAVELVGAARAELVDDAGRLLGEVGTPDPDAPRPAWLEVSLAHGRLRVQGSTLAPIFGIEERRLVARLGVLVDLAFDRADLLAAERAARAEAEQAAQDRDVLLADAAHELRGPALAVAGFAELLGGPMRDDLAPRAADLADRIAVNARRLVGLSRMLESAAHGGVGMRDAETLDYAAVVADVEERTHGTVAVGPGRLRGSAPDGADGRLLG